MICQHGLHWVADASLTDVSLLHRFSWYCDLGYTDTTPLLNCICWDETGVQSFDLDCVGSIPTIPPMQITCFVDHFNKTRMMMLIGFPGIVILATHVLHHCLSASVGVKAISTKSECCWGEAQGRTVTQHSLGTGMNNILPIFKNYQTPNSNRAQSSLTTHRLPCIPPPVLDLWIGFDDRCANPQIYLLRTGLPRGYPSKYKKKGFSLGYTL